MRTFYQRLDEIFLIEKVYGKLATVFHRTGKGGHDFEKLSKSIVLNGFFIGSGKAYREGVYTTYEVESQFNDYMEIY